MLELNFLDRLTCAMAREILASRLVTSLVDLWDLFAYTIGISVLPIIITSSCGRLLSLDLRYNFDTFLLFARILGECNLLLDHWSSALDRNTALVFGATLFLLLRLGNSRSS